ncbi:hypothetical protein ACPF8X_03825 [Streptomyces sp. G35A]
MLADDCAPHHAASLANTLSYAHSYAKSLSAMLAEGKPDPEKAARLVQALRNMLCAAEDDLDPLDDVQQELDATEAIQGLPDVELFRAITEPPTYGYP